MGQDRWQQVKGVMATLQQEARALGDPTRHAIFRSLADSSVSLDVEAIASQFDLHHNAIRQHLTHLVDAGLVVQTTAAATGRGRPRLNFAVAPGTASRWGVVGPYERLSVWLAEMVRTGDSPVEVGKRVGRRMRLGDSSAVEPAEVLAQQMASEGFDPVLYPHGDGADLMLRSCPFEATAVADPDTVCQLHLGMAYGLAEGLRGIAVESLTPNDPRRANCRLRCRIGSETDTR